MSYEKNENLTMREILISGTKGFLLSVILAAVLLFGFAAIACMSEDPSVMIAPLGYTALYITAIAGGISASRFSGDMSLGTAICGGTSGIILLLILIFMTLIPTEANPDPLSPLVTVIMYAAVPLTSAIFGYIFRKKPRTKVRHRRKR